MPVIDTKATGAKIKTIMKEKGGFNSPQAIFKWMRGDAVPTIDNIIIIADMFDVTIDEMIVINRI